AAEERATDLAEAAGERADALKDADRQRPRVEADYAKAVSRVETRYAAALAKADGLARGEAAAPQVEVNFQTADGKTLGTRSAPWKAGLRKAVANPEYYLTVLFTWAHRAAILLLPIVGLTLALVYRNRREIFLY